MNQSQEVTAILATFANLSPADADATAEHLRGILTALPEEPAALCERSLRRS